MKRFLIAVVLILGLSTVATPRACTQTTHKAVLTWTDALNPTGTTYRVYGALGFSRNRWVPCGLGAADGSDFCKKHADAVIGGALRLWVAGVLEPDAAKNLKIRGNRSQKKQGSIRRKLPPSESQA
jgi:hypothetical protein